MSFYRVCMFSLVKIQNSYAQAVFFYLKINTQTVLEVSSPILVKSYIYRYTHVLSGERWISYTVDTFICRQTTVQAV